MQINPQDRERILRSLRWLVRDAEHRFNDIKNDGVGLTGGYSQELKDACELLRDLEQGELSLPMQSASSYFSEAECLDMGYTIGMKTKQIIEFYLHYGRQGWLLGNGLPVVDLRLAMRDWFSRDQAGSPPELERNAQGKTPRQVAMEKKIG